MKLTNKLNLPMPIYRAVEWQNAHHSVGKADLSCTQLIDAPLIAWLRRQYSNQLEEDVSERLWPLYGTLMHSILEEFAAEGEHVETEVIAEVDGFRVSGHIDLVVTTDGLLQDYKFTSSWTVKSAKAEGKVEWERQLNVYRFLLEHAIEGSGIPHLPKIKKLQIVALLRDWGPRHERDGLKPVEVIEVPLWSEAEGWDYMQTRIQLHKAAQGDMPPPMCSPEERWATPTTYAVMKKGRQSALKVCHSETAAQDWMATNQKGEWIEERPGQNKRCESYCGFGKQGFCPYQAAN